MMDSSNRRSRVVTCIGVIILATVVLQTQARDDVADLLSNNQKNLADEGRTFLIQEATRASFFVIGGLHGDKETPALVQDLGEALRPSGYRYTAVEMSPWAANRLLS